MSCRNFIQGNTAQKWIWSRLLPRYTLKDSIEIYFIFFWVFLHFLLILEFYMNFWNCKRKWKIKNDVLYWAGLLLLAWPSGEIGPRALTLHTRCARSPRQVRTGRHTVAHSPTARRCPAGDEVFTVSSSEHPGWCRARWGGEVLTVEDRRRWGGGGAHRGGAQWRWRRSGGQQRGWWSPAVSRECTITPLLCHNWSDYRKIKITRT
jgi:hypothetical protein